MAESFKCPTCAAPLKFEGKMMQDCNYCGGNIIVPAEMFRNEEFEQQQKMKKLDAVLKTVFSNMNVQGGGQHYVIDLRSSSNQAQNNLSNIFTEIQSGHHATAVQAFTQTFGFNEQDAEKTVTAIEHGQGVDVSNMRLYPHVPQKSPYGWIIKMLIALIIFIFVLPVVVSILFILLMYMIQ